MTIRVEKKDTTTFAVTVEAQTTTTHTVTLTPSYATKLTDGKVTPEELVQRSFEFLLEREPNTSILSSFDLPVIGRYFPEFESEIRNRLG
jgi:hypothetical protein